MQNPPTRTRRTVASLTTLALGATGLLAVAFVNAGAAHAAAVPTLSPLAVPNRGASVPFIEQEAEYAATNGSVVGPDRQYGHLVSEASGRQAVTLNAVGQYVEFTLTAPANSIDFRYSLPDSSDGKGRDASMDLLVNGQKLKSVDVTSKYSWYYGGYPFNNNPGDSNPHHFFDETRTLLGTTYPVGTKIRLQVSSTAQSPSFTVDLADFEKVADPIAKPAGAIDVVADYGADPTGATDSTAKFQAAVNAGAAQGRTVYIPQGNFTLYDHVVVDKVTLAGAGPWYSVLGGRDPINRNRAAGIYGKYVAGGGYGGGVRPQEAGGPSQNVTLKDFAIIGDVRERVDDDQVNGLGGAMSNSTVDNLWIQHTKVGAWMDGPMDHFTIKNSRILDQTADGVNFHTGVTNSTVTNTFLRNTGDDGLASWPERLANTNDSFTHNTVVLPILANNIVTYGGKDFTISDNVMADTITNGGGLHIANRYPGVTSGNGTAVSGTITAARNTLIRTGNSDYNWQFGVGAIWFDGLNEPITGATINISDTDILDSSYEAIQTIEGGVTGVNLTNVNIDGAGTYAIQAQANAQMKFTNVKAKNIAQAATPIHNCVGTGFQITDGGGNSGLSGSTCTGQWPAPVWTYNGVPVGGDNGGSSPTPSPSASTSTPASPSPSPSASASSTCPSGTGNLAQGRPATASGTSQTYGPGNAVDGDANSYWESANNAFPQWIQVDLGCATSLTRAVLKLPPATAWAARTQTLTVQGSTDGSSFSTLVGSAGYTFDPASGNTVTVNLPATPARYLRLTVTGNTGWPAAQLSELQAFGGGNGTSSPSPSSSASSSPSPSASASSTCPSGTGNLAQGRPATASGTSQTYGPGNAVDGDANSYWESANNAFPQWIQVDLGCARNLAKAVLKLPPATAWATRTQTVTVQGSTDGTTFTTLVGATGYTFDPATGNTVTVNLPANSTRYLRLTVTGNTGWPAGQLSELQAFTS
ncbi:discoidin domain-containing protein [Kitasatospora phosalacinea]|uniref:Mycodextranase n=1 Tax=Kitasatospora phosalacinea TaxID=2065 RepID=A0A9W6PBZ6_9ACTN|nr:mycodextranase [Kitasatospora phosalacinea]